MFRSLIFVVFLGAVASAAPDAEMMKEGEALYKGIGACFTCHMPEGQGQLKAVPPLAGSDWLKDSPDRTIAMLLRGIAGPIKVNGQNYHSAMPPQVHLSDQQLAAIITYVNNAWGNKGATVKPEQVAKARKSLPSAVYTPKTLLKAFPFSKALAKNNGTYTQNAKPAETADKEPIVYRTFMPGASPAAFAVALPGNHYYCWDAGECRLRYVWTKGGFIRGNERHWSSNGKRAASFDGIPYYRARTSLLKPDNYSKLAKSDMEAPFYDTTQAQDFPISIGDAAGPPRYRGYQLIDGFPEFRYSLGGYLIRERIQVTDDKLGIERHFSIDTNQPVVFSLTPSSESTLTASAGKLDADGTLRLTAAEAKSFTVTIVEINPASKLPGGAQ